MAERLFDKASYSIVRTNPKLTANVKLVSNGDNLYLESFSANTELASSTFKAFKISGKDTYDKDVFRFFQGGKFPTDLAYEVFQEYQDVSVLSQYQNQYEMFYSAGTRSVSSLAYTEDLGMLAPLWLNEQIPNYFVVFRIDNPAAVNNINAELENADYLNAQTSANFTKNVLENCTAIKTFDLSSNSLLGSYIRNYRNQESFPKSPLTVSWRKDEPIQWNGINYKKGGFTSAGSYSYDDLVAQDSTIIQNEFFFTQGFERNGVLLANLINLEFLFSDKDAPDYSINRYFGLYVNEVEEGRFDISGEGFFKNTEKTQLPKIKTIQEVSEQLNTPFEIENSNGVLVFLDPSKTTTVTGLPTPNRVNEVESIFYVKDKNNDFHTIKKGSTWGNNQIRLFDKTIDISKLAGFKTPDTYANASIIQRKGQSTCSFKITNELVDGFKITFYDSNNRVGEVAASSIEVPNVGQSKYHFFNPNGTPQEIAKAITNAINIGIPKEKRFFEASYNNDTVYVESRFSGSRFNRLNFELDFTDYPLMVNAISTYPSTSVNNPNENFVGGNDVTGSLLKVTAGDQDRFVKGNYVQSKDGFAQIGDWVPYLEEPIKNSSGKIIGYNNIDTNVIITLNDNQIETTRSGQVALYSDYRPSFGRFSIFPIRDFDYDFYSTMFSQMGELSYEEYYYKNSLFGRSNPEIREFYYDDGGFATLIGLLKDSDPDQSFDSIINSEYDRLEENYLKQQAVASRVIPYINKWSYLNDGKNVRNLPYSLNLSEAFGQNNFAPSKYSIGQDPLGFTHEWYYLCEFPDYFDNEAIKSSWSYIDNAPVDSTEENPFTGSVYSPGTFQKIDKDYFNDYFIVDKFTTGGQINLIDKQLRYGRFSGGDEKNFAEAFLRGVRIIAKPKADINKKPNFNAKSLSYVNDGRFNDYRFSVMLIPNAPDKPETQIKFIKNDKWKTVVMLIFLTLENKCVNKGSQSIDRTVLYSFESDYQTQDCQPIQVSGQGYLYERGIVQGAISFLATSFNPTVQAYLVQGVVDVNGIPPRFLRDITIGSDGQFNPIKFEIGSDIYEISGIQRVVSDSQFFATTITLNGSPYIPGGPTPSSLELLESSYFTVGGGFNAYTSRLTDVGFASIFKNVNQGAPNIVYETIDKEGNRILDNNGDLAQTFSIELRAQEDIIKSVYIGVLPDPAKPTVFNLTDIIGYDLSLQTKPRVTPIGRHAGYYEPTSLDIFFFRDPYINIDFDTSTGTGSTGTGSTGTGSTGGPIPDEVYKYKVMELCRYANTQFNSSDTERFGQIRNLFYHKVNEEDPSTVLELSTDSAYLSLYPLINEVGIFSRDFYTFSSNWEPAYFRKSIDKSQIQSVIGTRAMTERKSFFGSKYLKVPQQIELETFIHSEEFIKDAIKQPSLIEGNFMTEENDTYVKFYMFIQKRLIEYLFGPIKEQFKKYIKPEFSYADIETLDDDVERYIRQNILQLYKIANVDFYVKSTRENLPLNYSTAALTNSEKAASGLTINTAVGSKLLNTNLFDLSLIYNKRTGFTESFGFSITIVKK